jgi:hypothetical protein
VSSELDHLRDQKGDITSNREQRRGWFIPGMCYSKFKIQTQNDLANQTPGLRMGLERIAKQAAGGMQHEVCCMLHAHADDPDAAKGRASEHK